MKVIKSRLLIDGTGSEPLEDPVILIENCRISKIGTEIEMKVPR